MTDKASDWVHGGINGWNACNRFEMGLIPGIWFGASHTEWLGLVVARGWAIHESKQIQLILQYQNVFHGHICATIT